MTEGEMTGGETSEGGTNVPDGLLYMETDEWAKIEGTTATIGITDYAQDQLGDIVQLDLPAIGTEAKKGEPAGAIESVKAVEDFHYPLSGKVTELNPALAGDSPDPGSIKSGPYSVWLLKIEISNPAEKDSLLSPEAYKAKISS